MWFSFKEWILSTIVNLSAKTRIVRTSMHIEKKFFLNYLWNYACYWKIFLQDWWGQKSASNQQKLCTIILSRLWWVQKSMFYFHSLNGEYVKCVCLQCGRRKQNRYHFLGKTATIDKCVISYFYSLLVWPITGEHFKLIPSYRQMQT